MSKDQTSQGTHNAISSAGSGGGRTLSDWQDGQQIDLFGQEVAHANPFRWQGLEKAMRMKGTSGRSSPDLFVSANLQRFLESRLRQSLDVNGSPEYDLTWKRWDMSSGPPICALRASGRRTFGRDCGGWQTPTGPREHDSDNSESTYLEKQANGWATPAMTDHKGVRLPEQVSRALTTPKQSGGPAGMGNGDGCRGGWATPRAGKTTDENPETWQKRKDRGDVATMPLTTQAQLTGWQTPKSSDCKSPGKSRDIHLKHQAEAAGYPTPRTITGGGESAERKQELGRTTSGGGDIQAMAEQFRMPDMTGWKLNPLFSLYLMGYPPSWALAGLKASQKQKKG